MKSLSAGLIIGSALKPDFLELRKVLFHKEFMLFFGPFLRPVTIKKTVGDFDGNKMPNPETPDLK